MEIIPMLAEGLSNGGGLGLLGAGLGAGLVTFGGAKGIGQLAASALESQARQPEVAGRVFTSMIIAAALIEGFTFFALIICFQISGKVFSTLAAAGAGH